MNAQEAEKYVREHWPRASDYCGLLMRPIRIFTSFGVVTFTDWFGAYEFTKQRKEEIRLKKEEIKLIKMVCDVDWVRCEWLADAERILAILESRLQDLQRGFKEQTQPADERR